jgi:hypothetical protein
MSTNETHLHILWANADPVTSEHMVLMYAKGALTFQWWEKVTVIIWGATSKLVAENADIQAGLASARELGVEFSACESCADNLGTKAALRNLGLDVRRWGPPLTELIKNKQPLITV